MLKSLKYENIIGAKWFSKKELDKINPNNFMDNYVTKSFDLIGKNENTKIDFLELS